ncbi:hypothetical protein K1719_018439 [Acacia pycnantha]|nr:hypothetical protein K1719_018439 [Acacia pycnantha]
MDKGQHSGGSKKGKDVLLDLNTSITTKKGRALLGHLETDKNLNKGIVISMIQKGWGLDRDMEIHDMPDKSTYLFRFIRQEDYNRVLKGRPWAIQGALLNLQYWDEFTILCEVSFEWCPFWVQFHGLPHAAFDGENVVKLGNEIGRTMLYESPRVQERLSHTFIRARVLINILEPLTSGFWVPRPQHDSIWVTVHYERLQNYCYDCGRIGHDTRTCKFQTEPTEDAAEDTRSGNGLGTPHVKTIEDDVVIHDQTWDEAILVQRKPSPVTGHAQNRRSSKENAQYGKSTHLGNESGIHESRHEEAANGQICIMNGINEDSRNGNQVSRHALCHEVSANGNNCRRNGINVDSQFVIHESRNDNSANS